MAYSRDFIEKVRVARRRGYSVKELAKKMSISADTVSRWVRDIKLNREAKKKIERKKVEGQMKGYATLLNRRLTEFEQIQKMAHGLVQGITVNSSTAKLCCSLLFWCEGSKETSSVRFTNSDPTLIKLFLDLLREGFSVKNNKLRILMHLHRYHNVEKQKAFWSKVCGIPPEQFSKPYLKSHTGKNKHTGYQGCVTIKYYDAKVAKELSAIYNSFAKRGVSQW